MQNDKQKDNISGYGMYTSANDPKKTKFTLIDALDVESIGNWIICCRVVRKEPKTDFWRNDGSQSCFFMLDCVDSSGEIRILGYDRFCDAYEGYVFTGEFIKIRAAKIVKKDPHFNKTRHTCELHIVENTWIDKVREKDFWDELDERIPFFHANHTMALNDISFLEENTFVDAFVITVDVGPLVKLVDTITQEWVHCCRKIAVMDRYGGKMDVVFWDYRASSSYSLADGNHVLFIRNGKVKFHEGRCYLDQSWHTTIFPDIKNTAEAAELRDWYKRQQPHDGFT